MEGLSNNPPNTRLKNLLQTVVKEVRLFAEAQSSQIQRLTKIGIALSAERDINKLLELIIDEAMDFTNSEAGTLYSIRNQGEDTYLDFKILKNKSLDIHQGGTSSDEVTLLPVPVCISGQENHDNVSSHVALTGEPIRISDVYEAEEFDFSGPREYDKKTGYRSQSMLVVPMKNHQDEIIGVLQLLNAREIGGEAVIAYAREYEEMIISLASQAAVALENAELIRSLQDLFDAFIRSIATAIDEKSPYTGGHIRRVTELTMRIAEEINNAEAGPFSEMSFTADELEELRIAAWMHDVGKITTPDYVIDKAEKLETVFNRIELVQTRFALIRQLQENAYLNRLLQLKNSENSDVSDLEAEHLRELKYLDSDLEFIVQLNSGDARLEQKELNRLEKLAARRYSINGTTYPYLTENEVKNLSVLSGTLTTEERQKIEHHARVTIDILKQLPFPKKLAHVPQYAGCHHEKLDGSGYPDGLTAEQLPLQARIMALADVFEALTARDRPYKSPMALSKATEILDEMCRANHLDRDIFNLFIKSGLHIAYAQKELDPSQIDISK